MRVCTPRSHCQRHFDCHRLCRRILPQAVRVRPGTRSAGQPCTARNTVGRPTGSNRARPAARPTVQPGRPTVHGQPHGQPCNRATVQPCGGGLTVPRSATITARLPGQRHTRNLSGKLRKVQTPFKQSSSPQDSEESLELVRQKRTARLVTPHWETQQHSDVNTNLAQFNKRLRFVSLQNQLAKAVCKSLLHDTNASLSD